MSETTARLRWKHEPEASRAALAGYAGTFSQDLFRIYAPDESDDRWILASLLPGADHRSAYGGSAEELMPVAERLLGEFVMSLGATFPDDLRRAVRDERDWQSQRAADYEEGSDGAYQADMALGAVNALDWTLVTIDKMTAKPAAKTATAGEETGP